MSKLVNFSKHQLQENETRNEEIEQYYLELMETVQKQQGMTYKFKQINGCFVHTFCLGELLYRLGFTPEQIVGKTLEEIMLNNHDLLELKLSCYKRAWNGEENVTYEAHLGGVVYLGSLRPIRKQGVIEEVIVNCVDITRRRQTENELNKVKQQLESFINHTSDPIYVVDRDLNVIFVNPAFEKIYGWSRDEMMFISIVPENLYDECVRLHNEVREGIEVINYETIAKTKQNSLINVSLTISPFMDSEGNLIGTSVISRDITESKRYEQALSDREEKYRMITDNMSDLIVVIDINGNLTYCSPTLRSKMGYDLDDYQGKSLLNLIHPHDKNLVVQSVKLVIISKNALQFEFRSLNSNGKRVFFQAKGTPIYNDMGQISNVLIVARDITEQKKSEELLRKADRLSLIGDLATETVNDIHKPLENIKQLFELIDEDMEAVPKKYMKTIKDQIERIKCMTDNFLMLSNKQDKIISNVDISYLIYQAISLSKSMAESHNIEVTFKIEPDIPFIRCAEEQIRIVFVQMIKNAKVLMPNGGETTIHLRSKGTKYISICFINKQYPDALESKRNSENPYDYLNNEKATGLGLKVSYQIIREHKGNIVIDNNDRQGTIVEILLPANSSGLSQPENEDKLSKLSNREKDVLFLIGQGKSNKEISSELYISEHTVKNHITNIFNKLNLSDRSQAIIYLLSKKTNSELEDNKNQVSHLGGKNV